MVPRNQPEAIRLRIQHPCPRQLRERQGVPAGEAIEEAAIDRQGQPARRPGLILDRRPGRVPTVPLKAALDVHRRDAAGERAGLPPSERSSRPESRATGQKRTGPSGPASQGPPPGAVDPVPVPARPPAPQRRATGPADSGRTPRARSAETENGARRTTARTGRQSDLRRSFRPATSAAPARQPSTVSVSRADGTNNSGRSPLTSALFPNCPQGVSQLPR